MSSVPDIPSYICCCFQVEINIRVLKTSGGGKGEDSCSCYSRPKPRSFLINTDCEEFSHSSSPLRPPHLPSCGNLPTTQTMPSCLASKPLPSGWRLSTRYFTFWSSASLCQVERINILYSCRQGTYGKNARKGPSLTLAFEREEKETGVRMQRKFKTCS